MSGTPFDGCGQTTLYIAQEELSMEKSSQDKKSTWWDKLKGWLSLRWVQISLAFTVVAAFLAALAKKIFSPGDNSAKEAQVELDAAKDGMKIEREASEEQRKITEAQSNEEEEIRGKVLDRLKKIQEEKEKENRKAEDVIMKGDREDVESYLRNQLKKEE